MKQNGVYTDNTGMKHTGYLTGEYDQNDPNMVFFCNNNHQCTMVPKHLVSTSSVSNIASTAQAKMNNVSSAISKMFGYNGGKKTKKAKKATKSKKAKKATKSKKAKKATKAKKTKAKKATKAKKTKAKKAKK